MEKSISSVHPNFSCCDCCDGFIDFCECTKEGKALLCKCARGREDGLSSGADIEAIFRDLFKLNVCSYAATSANSGSFTSSDETTIPKSSAHEVILDPDAAYREGNACLCCNSNIYSCLCLEDGLSRCLVCYRDAKAISCGCCKGFYFNCKCILGE